jgi:hypothetical protein
MEKEVEMKAGLWGCLTTQLGDSEGTKPAQGIAAKDRETRERGRGKNRANATQERHEEDERWRKGRKIQAGRGDAMRVRRMEERMRWGQ